VEGCRCCNNLNQYAITEIFRTFKDSSSLKAFVLKCDALNEENIKLLRELTLKNRNITCVIIQIEGKYIPKKVLEAFSKLPLTILSINSERNNNGDNVYMDITPIIRIKTLRKLAISK
jgi:vacuolar-type H+-ATPase subunit I/STV1